MITFQEKVKALRAHHEELLSRKNELVEWGNGIYEKYKNPILTAEHTPLEWRYDFDEKSFCLTGRRFHKKFSLGDPIRIKVARANLERKQLDFALAE